MSSASGLVVEQVWRFPVKSLGGERVDSSLVDTRGLVGDRLWAVHDTNGKFGSGKDSHRFTRMEGLLTAAAHLPAKGAGETIETPVVTGPDGREYPVATGAADRYLSDLVGRPNVRVRREAGTSHFDEVPLTVIGTATLAWLGAELPALGIEPRRFRANLVVRTDEPFAEESWLGRAVQIGDGDDAVHAEFDRILVRCVMVGMAQRGLPESGAILKRIGQREAQPLRLAIGGYVRRPGSVRVNDRVTVL